MATLITKLKNRVRFNGALAALDLCLNARFTRLVPSILAAAANRINQTGEFTVLCLGRSVFMDDVRALATYGQRLRYISIHRIYWKKIFSHFLSAADTQDLTEFNYHSRRFPDGGNEKYYHYLLQLLPRLQRRLGFHAVLTGNIGYFEQQEIIRVCRELKIPFIVLHKEAMDVYGGYLNLYKNYRFDGDRILFYNEKIKDALLALNIPGVTADKVHVVGIPRLDAYFQDLANPPWDKTVLFFSFFPKDKFLNMITDQGQLQWAIEAYGKFHRLVIEFAKSHPEYQVTIKTKSSTHYVNYVTDIVAQVGTQIPNLVVTNQGSPAELIKQSNSIIGFNSTALIEAVILGRKIISPNFNQLLSDTSWDFFADYPELVTVVKTGQELETAIGNAVSTAVPEEYRQRFLQELIYTPDGRASGRTEAAIIETITEKPA